MVDTKPSTSLKPVLAQAIEEARTRASANVEAEHLLLALATDQSPRTAAILAEAHLDHDAIDAALRRERATSLDAAGIAPVDTDTLTASPRQERPGWGTSTKEALARGHRAKGETGDLATELLIGILSASLGTVPRALTLAGIERAELLETVRPG